MTRNSFACVFFSVLFSYAGASPCKARSYGTGNIVCVCTETYCDELNLLSNVTSKQSAVYETGKDGTRFRVSVLNFSSAVDPGVTVVTVNSSEIYQFILGFGGAFTDAAGINFKSVSSQLQKQIMRSYFDKTGLQYNMGRIPIASCDFSTYPYSYDDVENDFDLKHFKLAKEDFSYKIPYIEYARSLSKDDLLLFGSPWSAPAWMKTNGAMNGQGGLKGDPGGQYYKTWANYLVRFVKAYEENNITLWGLTTQNEPSDGCIADFPFQSMCFPPDKQRDFLKYDLGPALKKAGLGPDNLRLMILDDVKGFLPKWADIVMSDPESAQYVTGVAFHWYYENIMPHRIISITRAKYPQLFYLATEACTGSYPWEIEKVSLGDWSRAERYASDIIQDLLNWSIGWIDWNLALDMQGGPNWVKNFVDAPVILNAKANEFYKQPMYYILAHFSKCVPRGSVRIGLEIPQPSSDRWLNFEMIAFQTPRNNIVVIAVNRKDEAVNFFLHDPSRGYLNVTLIAHSIQSYVW